MEYRIQVERRHDGDHQWVRQPSTRKAHPRHLWGRYGRGSHPPPRAYTSSLSQQNVVGIEDIEFLIGIYAATGEGRGSYLAAVRAQEVEREGLHGQEVDGWRHLLHVRNRRVGTRRARRPHGLLPRSSSDESSDGHDGGQGGPSQVPPERPPGRPPGGVPPFPEGDVIITVPELTHETPSGPLPRPPPIYASGSASGSALPPDHKPPESHVQPKLGHDAYDDKRRRSRSDFSFRPQRLSERHDSHLGSLDEPRKDFRTARLKVHTGSDTYNSSYIIQPGARTSSSTATNRQDRRSRSKKPSVSTSVSTAIPPVYEVDEESAHHHRSGRHPSRVEEASEVTEDEVPYTSMPIEEDAIRMSREAEIESYEPRHASKSRRRSKAAAREDENSNEDVGLRGGDGSLVYDSDQREYSRYHHHHPTDYFGRLRGGGGGSPVYPTRTSSIGAGLIPRGDIDTTSREIELYFYCSKHGKVITSGLCERYTTFQEFRKEAAPDKSQLADVWFVKKLQEHYKLLNRRQHNLLWDLLSVKTIGFASFIRFERTVSPNQDLLGFSVTAKVPAIVAETEAEAQFKYSLRYPHRSTKMMLYLLDWLASTSHPKRPCFYVVEIKEAADITKTYIMLLGLIVLSTAGGTVYSVVQSDPSTGISIASYVLTVLSIILAFITAADWLGVKSPDSFAFAYSVEENAIMSAIGTQNL